MCRAFDPLLVNTVVGFIGPEYLYDGKQILRAGLEDHFCGKLLGVPMGVDVCYTNHAEADADDTDTLLFMLGGRRVLVRHLRARAATTSCSTTRSLSFQDVLYGAAGPRAAPGAGVRDVARLGRAARRRRPGAAAVAVGRRAAAGAQLAGSRA